MPAAPSGLGELSVGVELPTVWLEPRVCGTSAEVCIAVDLFGARTLHTPPHAAGPTVHLGWSESVRIELGDALYVAIDAALRSAELERLRLDGTSTGPERLRSDGIDRLSFRLTDPQRPNAPPLGLAQLSLSQLLHRSGDAERERLPLLNAQRRRVGWLSVSVRALAALRSIQADGDAGVGISVEVSELQLTPSAAERVGASARELLVAVELPGGVPAVRTPAVRTRAGRASFGFTHSVRLVGGSDGHTAMLEAVEAAAALRVQLSLLAAPADAAKRELLLGTGRLSLPRPAQHGRQSDERFVVQLRDPASDADVGTVSVRLRAAAALRLLRQSAVEGRALLEAVGEPDAALLVRRPSGRECRVRADA